MKPPNLDRMKDYDAERVQLLWEEAISLDADVQDPYYATDNSNYNERLDLARERICLAKKKITPISFNKAAFRSASFTEQKVLDSTFRFEVRMLNISHSVCASCFETRIEMTTTVKSSICQRCQKKIDRSAYNGDNIMLPTWTSDDGTVQYHVPPELENLTVAETLLIQRVSPLVPLVHIRNGTLGMKGHVCSFMQDVNNVATRLPNLPKDVKAVKMIRSFTDCRGVDQVKVFMVNKGRVLKALHWLIKHHQDYRRAYEQKELIIDTSNLDWMESDEEAELPVIELHKCCADDEVDLGISRDQCYVPDLENDDFEASGITCPENAALTSEASDEILRTLKKAAGKKSNIPSLDWPQHSNEAISEFDCTVRIFVNAFPHLFPGGIADVKEPERKIGVWISKWAKHLLLYSDGRFARDNVWGFFAYNYCLRNRNTESGSFFVNRHISNPPSSLEELQNSLRNGDYSFVNKMTYFTKKVRGSDSYWRQKRSELYNWTHHHIAEGRGAPNGFFTLSCAEYFWPDMIRLLEDRIWIAEGRHRNGPGAKTDRHGNVIDLISDRKARNKAVNEYAIVVQEFFIKRTEDYLNTVGRHVFGIEHYWCRFEFAKGRGQIHAHILVILSKSIQARIQERVDLAKGNREREAKYVSDWANEQFGMTATFNNDLVTER